MNSKESVKSRGIVAFAVNTDATDYVSIAQQTLKLASHTLNLPHTLITEDLIAKHIYASTRYNVDTSEFVEWKNMGRNTAYELSPYDETIVIDADYLIQDCNLLKIFESSWDYTLMRTARSLNDEPMPDLMGVHSLPYVWATVFAFRKTPRAKMFFDLVRRIQRNYHYYRELFKAESRIYRNDYAFAMADIILNGFCRDRTGIPGPMLNVTQSIDSITVKGNSLVIKDSKSAYVVPRMNLHVMSKQYLQSDNFNKFINDVTA